MHHECCCHWGAAVGKRHGIASQEWPEFGCHQCPVHQAGGGEQPDELCKRHKREAKARDLVLAQAAVESDA